MLQVASPADTKDAVHFSQPPCVRRGSSRVSDVDHQDEAGSSSIAHAMAAAVEAVSIRESVESLEATDDAPAPTCIICFDEFDRRRPAHRIPCACQEGTFENHVSVHQGCIRAWAAQKSSCPLCRAQLSVQCTRFVPPPGMDLRAFVTKPLAMNAGQVACSVLEKVQPNGPPVYELFLETGASAGLVHLLTGRWTMGDRNNGGRTGFVIELPGRGGAAPLALVESNLLGTRWTVTKVAPGTEPGAEGEGEGEAARAESATVSDAGSSTRGRRAQIFPGAVGVTRRRTLRPSSICGPPAAQREQLAAVGYKANRFSLDAGPRAITIATPAVTEDGELDADAPPTEEDAVLEQAVEGRCHEGTHAAGAVSTFHNRSPVWDERYEAYVLNFLGRVRVASVKNFQIVQDDNLASETMLQFGRVGPNSFTMDVQWPFSVVQAFGISLTSIAPKLAVK